MKVGIDANPLVGDRGGVGWHTYYLLRAILAAGQDVDIVGYLRPGTSPPEEVQQWTGAGRLCWVTVSKWGMSRRGAADQLDLYHGTNFRMHTTGRYGGIVTIHDLWLERFPQYSPKFLGQKLSSYKTKRIARRARKVVTVSQFSAYELMDVFGLTAEQIVVIPNGVSGEFFPHHDEAAMEALKERAGLTNSRFILFVGGADPRKNHRVFLEAVSLVRNRIKGRTIVLVGSALHPFGSYQETAKSYGLSADVLCPGRLSREDLRLFYSYTDLFVFPSLYEGFGMPILEAMACGAPVITSKTTALGEVAGDAALLVDPNNARQLGEAMVNVLESEPLRESLKKKGLVRVKQYSWQQAASKTLQLYSSLCQ